MGAGASRAPRKQTEEKYDAPGCPKRIAGLGSDNSERVANIQAATAISTSSRAGPHVAWVRAVPHGESIKRGRERGDGRKDNEDDAKARLHGLQAAMCEEKRFRANRPPKKQLQMSETEPKRDPSGSTVWRLRLSEDHARALECMQKKKHEASAAAVAATLEPQRRHWEDKELRRREQEFARSIQRTSPLP